MWQIAYNVKALLSADYEALPFKFINISNACHNIQIYLKPALSKASVSKRYYFSSSSSPRTTIEISPPLIVPFLKSSGNLFIIDRSTSSV